MGNPANDARARFEAAMAERDGHNYVLRLYVAGTTRYSLRAIRNIGLLCERYLQGRADLQVIDIYQQPLAVKEGQILAAPTLVKEHPLPVRKFVGDMSDTSKILKGLDLDLPMLQERSVG